MGLLTSQKIAILYEKYKNIDVTFTKEIIQVTGMITNQVYLKCIGDFWPCVIYSSSFQGSKVVSNTKSGIIQKLEKANNMTSLRFCFKSVETGNPVAFFVNTKVVGVTPYNGSEDMAIISLQFTQRPPDDLIEIIGRVLDANINSAKRKEERIMITPDSLRRMNIMTKESVVFIQGVPRRCILRDLSFSGAKVIMVGVEKFLINKDVALRIDFDDPRESHTLKGRFIRADPVEGRKELVALALVLDESQIPMGYKMRINDFLSQVRADIRGADEVVQPPKPVAKPTAAAPAPQQAAKPAGAAKPAEEPAANPEPKGKPDAKPAEEDSFDLQL